MHDVRVTSNKFNSNPYWSNPLDCIEPPIFTDLNLFDQNGYDLCSVEQLYSKVNLTPSQQVRNHRFAIVNAWFVQDYKIEGSVLNHANLFERKSYSGAALQQLKTWALKLPIYNRLINIRPKWGLDFSMDYYDSQGNTFEVLHWEYDSFNYEEIIDKKHISEKILSDIDWQDAAKQILKRKDEWFNLDFFAQSDYKCNYFGIGSEQWKMVIWK